jgi:hypothetical protein
MYDPERGAGSMKEIAQARINNFAYEAPRGPADTPIVIVPADSLKELLDEIQSLKSHVASQEIMIAELENQQLQDVERLALDIAHDRQRICRIEQKSLTDYAPPKGIKTETRMAKINEILLARGPTPLKELGRILGLDKPAMTRLVSKLDKRRYELYSRRGDGRQKVLRLKAQIR